MLFRLGRMQARLGRLDLARQFHEDQLVILEDLIRRDPTQKEYRFDAHGAHVHIHFSLSGCSSERERHLLKAWEILKGLVAEHPDDGELGDALAGLAGEMGDFFAAWERNADAEFYFREGLKHARDLVRQHPDRFLYQKQVGLNLTWSGRPLLDTSSTSFIAIPRRSPVWHSIRMEAY